MHCRQHIQSEEREKSERDRERKEKDGTKRTIQNVKVNSKERKKNWQRVHERT